MSYVNIPKRDLENELEDIGERVLSVGGSYSWGFQGREVVFNLFSHKGSGLVRIYTSLPVDGDRVRGCGKDAIRVVVGTEKDKKFYPAAKSRTVYRTASKTATNRVEEFLLRFRSIIREAYGKASEVKRCPNCGSPMAYRKVKTTKREFLGCSDYPNCKGTRNL
jgi:hypothetical protein